MSPIVTDPSWIRTVEPLYEGTEYTGTPIHGVTEGITTLAQFKAAHAVDASGWLPGMVVNITSGEVVLATSGNTSGEYFGVLFSEITSTLDECLGPNIRPTIWRGPATLKVHKAALKPDTTYTYGATITTNELIAENGFLIQRGSDTASKTVARLLEVDSDGNITIELMHPSVST